MRQTFILLCYFTLLINVSSAEDMHRWIDKEGKVHYSNNPVAIPQGKDVETEKIKTSKTEPEVDSQDQDNGQQVETGIEPEIPSTQENEEELLIQKKYAKMNSIQAQINEKRDKVPFYDVDECYRSSVPGDGRQIVCEPLREKRNKLILEINQLTESYNRLKIEVELIRANSR